jgi:soluble lytic murein transglycosylase-like protein
MRLRFRVAPAIVAAVMATFGWAVEARAEIVHLTSGRSFSIKSHRFEGQSAILTLRTGGEITCDRSLIEKVVADEVPYPEPAAESAESKGQPSTGGLLDATPYGEIISAVSEAHGVDPLLVRALIQVESNYKPKARSRKGAMGLMQLMPSTARIYNVRNPFDPKANIEAGIKHLKSLLDRFGKHDLALAAYNAGEGAVAKFNGVPPYRETRNYVSRILSLAGVK